MRDRSAARGLGHDFYTYPARMSPMIARSLIDHFSSPGDWVIDPFMGAGTAIVEAVASGRRVIGTDINPLAYLLARARTTPMSRADKLALESWASNDTLTWGKPLDDKWSSIPHGAYFADLAGRANALRIYRRRLFAKAVLLRTGQWVVQQQESPPPDAEVRQKLLFNIERLASAIGELTAQAHQAGTPRNELTAHRRVLLRTAIGLDSERRLEDLRGRIQLAVTSPPYPGVHILYHRWQLRSRRETAAPYWMIDAQDGRGPSYYTLGGRSQTGLENYFRSIQAFLESLRPLLAENGHVCMLLAFRDPKQHLPMFLKAARDASYKTPADPLLWREVPNRRWYARRQIDQSAAREVLIILQPL